MNYKLIPCKIINDIAMDPVLEMYCTCRNLLRIYILSQIV